MMLFLHGLESGTEGRKARWLAERHGALTLALDTRDATATPRTLAERGWSDGDPTLLASRAKPLAQARRARASARARRPIRRLTHELGVGGAIAAFTPPGSISWNGSVAAPRHERPPRRGRME